jgi:hypothetical protein
MMMLAFLLPISLRVKVYIFTGLVKPSSVIPAKAGIHSEYAIATGLWIPAFAGMTEKFVA